MGSIFNFLAYSTLNFKKIKSFKKLLILILSLLFYHYLILILQFYCDIYSVMWDPTGTEIEMLGYELHLHINLKSVCT
jgi:hypothetical protein